MKKSVRLISVALATGFLATTSANALEVENSRKLVLYWDVPGDILALTQGGHVPIVYYPADIRSLAGTGAETQLFLGVTIRDDKGAVIGVGSELETFHLPYDERLAHDTVWTVMLPGRGTIVAHELEDSTPDVVEFFRSIQKAGGTWSGSFEARSTVGPGKDGLGVIIGGTGEFEGAQGYMIEENHYRKFDFNRKTSEVQNRLTFFLTGAK
jgi:hypothetical protein